MKNEGKRSILEHFDDLEDRVRGNRRTVWELLLTEICAVVNGADSWARAVLWSQAKLS